MRYGFSWDSRSIVLTAMTFVSKIVGIGEQRANAQSDEPSCKFADSIYQDVKGKGFELVVRKPPRGSASVSAIVRIGHEKRGQIFEFDMVQSQGYGSTSLIDRKGQKRSYPINFFNSDLSQKSIFRAKTAPKYLFISGLGSEDYYGNSSRGGREVLLGDVMWEFSRCENNDG